MTTESCHEDAWERRTANDGAQTWQEFKDFYGPSAERMWTSVACNTPKKALQDIDIPDEKLFSMLAPTFEDEECRPLLAKYAHTEKVGGMIDDLLVAFTCGEDRVGRRRVITVLEMHLLDLARAGEDT